MKFSDVIKTLCVCGCVFGSMCDGVRGMERDTAHCERNICYTFLGLMSSNVSPSSWNDILNSLKNDINVVFNYKEQELLPAVGSTVIAISCPHVLKSLFEFCKNIDHSRSNDDVLNILSQLLLIFSKAAGTLNSFDIELEDSNIAISLSNDLHNLSGNLSLVGQLDVYDNPICRFAYILQSWMKE